MLEVFINFICAFMLALLGFYIIRKIRNTTEKINKKKMIIFVLNSIIVVAIHYINSKFAFLLNFIVNTLTYKFVFEESLNEAFLETSLLMLFLLISDILFVVFQIIFIPLEQVHNNIYIYLFSNIIVAFLSIILLKIRIITNKLSNIYGILSSKNLKLNVIFLILIMITIGGFVYKVFTNYKFNVNFFIDVVVMFTLLIIGIIFANSRDRYNRLSAEYDILLTGIKNFENWIEKEQFVRHEYKNQLAYIYSLSSEKKVKEKIEEVINSFLDVEDSTVHSLKRLPKSGLKGILYYKSIIAQNKKLKLTTNVSIKKPSILEKLSNDKLDAIAKIIGIMYDNAIESSKESKKKILLLEVYELKDKVNIVISNTFKKNSVIKNRNEKGISSKGKDRGYGLYFAKQILSKNRWLEEKNEIIDNYYIETITINKSTLK